MSDPRTAFERHIENLRGKEPPAVAEAAAHVHSTLETAWLSAQAIFGDRATPDVALAIYDRILQATAVVASETPKDTESSALEVEMGGFRVD
jgi:hypothetical protein